ncbi:probable phosphorylase b kinase regulatory subunit beta [Nilaparvata lugens]|nr:probable phosphorylase b kinase regulatory subunit beta [Nilaparvata lugens]
MERTPGGLRVRGYILPQQPTLSEMTRSELTFALLVEQTLNRIHQPEYRQIIVELLCIVFTILNRNPELSFRNQLDLDQLVTDAYTMFCKDGDLKEPSIEVFFSSEQSITTGYLARAVVNNVLKGGQLLQSTATSDAIASRKGNADQCRLQ